jgi:hypothetical protein
MLIRSIAVLLASILGLSRFSLYFGRAFVQGRMRHGTDGDGVSTKAPL